MIKILILNYSSVHSFSYNTDFRIGFPAQRNSHVNWGECALSTIFPSGECRVQDRCQQNRTLRHEGVEWFTRQVVQTFAQAGLLEVSPS